jgi:hypothetical protein
MDHGNAVLASLVEEQVISTDERKRMVLGAVPRSKSNLLAPFVPWWDGYERDADRETVACRQAAFFRSTFAPTLALALAAAHESGRVEAFAGRLEQGLRRRLERNLAPINSLAATIVLVKR